MATDVWPTTNNLERDSFKQLPGFLCTSRLYSQHFDNDPKIIFKVKIQRLELWLLSYETVKGRD